MDNRAIVIHAPRQLKIEARPSEPVGARQVKVRIHTGGICGSDLHYYLHGGFGSVRLKMPMILGHEIAGVVAECGAEVETVKVGTRVAVNPALPCGNCAQCRAGQRNMCRNVLFLGSAMRMPHRDGGFRDELICDLTQAVAIPDSMSFAQGALAEPLAVCLHAVRQAGELLGKRVLITGAGPIGLLLLKAARLAGAAHIGVTDVVERTLQSATTIGADIALNVAQGDVLAEHVATSGAYDVHFEASGSPHGLAAGVSSLVPRGICVLVGQGGAAPIEVSSIVTREIQLRGSFRFDTEFAMAVDLLGRGAVVADDLVSATLSANRAEEAFELAADKSRSVKVQLTFDR